MLPASHIAYTWLALSLLQEHLDIAPDADYRLVALAALGSDLIDKPLAWSYFYRRHKSAVLFAHTLWAYLAIPLVMAWRFPHQWIYAVAFVGHGILDRIWHFHDTFYWPLRGWRFHVWRRQGSEQERISRAYWIAFTRRPELWIWELLGVVALVWFVWRHGLYRPARLFAFMKSGRLP